jgi:hypothetical protein
MEDQTGAPIEGMREETLDPRGRAAKVAWAIARGAVTADDTTEWVHAAPGGRRDVHR